MNEFLNSSEYDFLSTNSLLQDNIILLGYSGSIAYGTNLPNSDIDIRGAALRSPRDILLNQNFEQVIDNKTDTTIYSLEKFCSLLTSNNPNTLELLGLKPEHYLYIAPAARPILEHPQWFLTKKVQRSFGGYVYAQKQRLMNGLDRKEKAKLCKYMMHIVRLLYTGIDILKYGVVITYREKEHATLMSIRNGDYLMENGDIDEKYFQLVEMLQEEFDYAASITHLPDKPDSKQIINYIYDVNYRRMKDFILSGGEF